MKDDRRRVPVAGLGRRDLMKLGAGVVMTGLTPKEASAQNQPTRAAPRTSRQPVAARTGTGWKNDANRASGNGPMDKTTRQLVNYVSAFSEKDLTAPILASLSNVMIDAMAALVAGFESEPARICARMARTMRSDLKCTVLGYGITTTPEMAAYANSCILRHVDFNDGAPGGHVSDLIPGILAIGEALHATGPQVLAAVTLGYEIMGVLSGAGGDQAGLDSWAFGPATALAVGKLLGLNEDQLANALSLALVPRVPLRVNRVGVLSMAKGCSSAPAIHSAVFSALLAREGMTGASEPFEARDGLWDRITGPFTDLRLPAASSDGRLCVERARFKRFPAEGFTQVAHEINLPEIRAWTKPEDIASIHIEMTYSGMLEIADPPKWDPRNRETADHSMPYEVARALIDGDIYIDSFTPEKCMDPLVRALMQKITVSANPDYVDNGQVRMTVRTKAGKELVSDTNKIRRGDPNFRKPMTHAEIVAKFNRVCAFQHVADDQRDRALAQWANLQAVKDMAEPMQTLAQFGRPAPL